MSFLLCPECFAWIEPIHDRCPDCQEAVDSSTPDPPLSRLELVIGDLIEPLGEVKVDRKMLPDCGLMYRTNNGLLFVPHRVEQQVQFVPGTDMQTSFLWWLAALAWSPLGLIVPFLKKNRIKQKQVRVFHPHWLSAEQSRELPNLLMQNPGVFFLSNNAVRVASRRKNCWRIVRVHGAPLKITPVGDARRFHEQMERMITVGTWVEG